MDYNNNIMILHAKVTPNADRNEVSEKDGRVYIHVTASPSGNKANKAVIEILAEYMKIKKNNIKIIKGMKSKEKIIELSQ